jgi:putative acetyltransferase
MPIRPYRPCDAERLAEVFHGAVHATSRADYSPGQLAAWSPRLPDAAAIGARAARGGLTLVWADEHDLVQAYLMLEDDGHVDHLYRHPDVAGRGVASALYDAVETHGRAQAMARFYVEASEAARRFLERKGFRTVARRDFMFGGVAMHNYAMEKSLAELNP